jgi:hypothetical protein
MKCSYCGSEDPFGMAEETKLSRQEKVPVSRLSKELLICTCKECLKIAKVIKAIGLGKN